MHCKEEQDEEEEEHNTQQGRVMEVTARLQDFVLLVFVCSVLSFRYFLELTTSSRSRSKMCTGRRRTIRDKGIGVYSKIAGLSYFGTF